MEEAKARAIASLVAQMKKNPPAMWENWAGTIPWRRAWQPTPVFLPGEAHGQRSLAGYGPRGRRESGTAEATAHRLPVQLGLLLDSFNFPRGEKIIPVSVFRFIIASMNTRAAAKTAFPLTNKPLFQAYRKVVLRV